jgi:alanine dehydrogenase
MVERTPLCVGIPDEIKPGEFRVAGTPEHVGRLRDLGCRVIVQRGAGVGSGFPDQDYAGAGAALADTLAGVYEQADLLWKVKEILPEEFGLVRQGHIIYTYLHAPPRPEMTRALLQSGCVAIAYEEMLDTQGRRFALAPMSRLAGVGAVVVAGQFCQALYQGCGKLLFRTAGTEPLSMTILGGGVAGWAATEAALAAGARVQIVENNPETAQNLAHAFPAAMVRTYSDALLREALPTTDVLVNCVMWMPGDPHLVTHEMVRSMRKGSLIVDVAADPNGAVETTQVTTHDDPIRIIDGVLHYAVQNIPSLFANTASQLLAEVTWPGLACIAQDGLEAALRQNNPLLSGVQFWKGQAVGRLLAETQGLATMSCDEILAE